MAFQSDFITVSDDRPLTTRRGFTDHEHLDDAQLIHMNGRVYDYNLGRFLSVDPFIQSPGNSQSMNPYSYIMNNPLAGTDPSGYMALSGRFNESPGKCIVNVSTCDIGPTGECETGNYACQWDRSMNSLKRKHKNNQKGSKKSKSGGSLETIDVEGGDEGTSQNSGGGSVGVETVATVGIGVALKEFGKELSKSLLKGGPIASAIIGALTPSTVADATMPDGAFMSEAEYEAQQKARTEELITTARQADGAIVLYHGTGYESAVALLSGGLSAQAALENKFPREVGISEVGFYMTPDPDVAFMFAARRSKPVILQLTFTETAFRNVMASGGMIQPIPAGKLPQSPGTEVILFPTSFPTFDTERSRGQILINGAQ